jgi:hypothetical protein
MPAITDLSSSLSDEGPVFSRRLIAALDSRAYVKPFFRTIQRDTGACWGLPYEITFARGDGRTHAHAYGANKAAGGTFVHDGVSLYYEIYGQGEPLLLVHGNSASIGSLAAQIEYFKAHYKVIAMDSRDQGRSSDSEGPITYEKMTDDSRSAT